MRVYLLVLIIWLQGCATPVRSLYSGHDAATIEVTSGGAAGWISNTLGSFWCKISDIDGEYVRLQEKIKFAPGTHRIDIRWSKVTTPPGKIPMQSVRGKKVLFLDAKPGQEYQAYCRIHRNIHGYFASFGLDQQQLHRHAWCDFENTECIKKGIE